METKPFEGTSAEMKKPTPWLASEDLMDRPEPVLEIEHVYQHQNAEFEGGRKETVYALAFKGAKKQLILNATNRKALVAMFGSANVKTWIGKRIQLYVATGIRKPGGGRNETCCGIRVRPAPPALPKP